MAFPIIDIGIELILIPPRGCHILSKIDQDRGQLVVSVFPFEEFPIPDTDNRNH